MSWKFATMSGGCVESTTPQQPTLPNGEWYKGSCNKSLITCPNSVFDWTYSIVCLRKDLHCVKLAATNTAMMSLLDSPWHNIPLYHGYRWQLSAMLSCSTSQGLTSLVTLMLIVLLSHMKYTSEDRVFQATTAYWDCLVFQELRWRRWRFLMCYSNVWEDNFWELLLKWKYDSHLEIEM